MSQPKAMYDEREDRVVWRCHASFFGQALDACEKIPVVEGYRLDEVRVKRRGRGKRVSLSLFFCCTDRRIRRGDPSFWESELSDVATVANA